MTKKYSALSGNKPCHRVEIHIAYSCANHCVFCSEAPWLEEKPHYFVPKRIIIDHLRRLARKGCYHVTFTGGEPTRHPDILDILAKARALGYATYLTTNGGRFVSRRFCRQALPLIDEVCFSIHGYNARTHEALTRRPKSFATLEKSLQHVQTQGRHTFCSANLVLTRSHMLLLPKIMEYIFSWPHIKRLLISLVAPEGNGLRHYESLLIRLSDFRKIAPALEDIMFRRQKPLHVFGMPLCGLAFIESISNDVNWDPRITLSCNEKKVLEETRSDHPTRDRVKTIKCRDCLVEEQCGGVFERYLDLFGDAELSPLKHR